MKLVNLFTNFNLSLFSLKNKVFESKSFSSSLVLECKVIFIVHLLNLICSKPIIKIIKLLMLASLKVFLVFV